MPLVVQVTHRPPAPSIGYVDQIVGLPRPDVTFRFAQGRLRRFDVGVVHVADQHLDVLLGFPESRPVLRLLSVLALTARLRVGRTALTRLPYGTDDCRPAGAIARLSRSILDRATTLFIDFDESEKTDRADRTIVIPHAHYRERFLGYPRTGQISERVLQIGTTPLAAETEILSDAARVQQITAAELVVAPSVATLEQMQGLFLALSLDRPVLTPRTPAMSRLAERVGPGWVYLHDGGIDAAAMDATVLSLRTGPRTVEPNLEGRDFATAHDAFAAAFLCAAASARRPRNDRRWPLL